MRCYLLHMLSIQKSLPSWSWIFKLVMCVVTSHFCNRRGWKACHGSERKISAQATPEQRMPYLLPKVWPLLSHLWLPKSMPNVCCLLPKMIFYKDFNTVTGTWQMISLASSMLLWMFLLASKANRFQVSIKDSWFWDTSFLVVLLIPT